MLFIISQLFLFLKFENKGKTLYLRNKNKGFSFNKGKSCTHGDITYEISRKSDENCGRDSATVFSIKMAAVTSLIVLMR